MELDEVFTEIKKAVYKSSTLDDKTKQKVRHILIKTYKELHEKEQKECVPHNRQNGTQSETVDYLKSIFGMEDK